MIGTVDDARDVVEQDDLACMPFLKCKMLYVNVARAWCRLGFISHSNSSFIIFVERSGTILRKTKFGKDRSKILG